MDPMIFVALVLFAVIVALWVALPGSVEAEFVSSPASPKDVAPLLPHQQQA